MRNALAALLMMIASMSYGAPMTDTVDVAQSNAGFQQYVVNFKSKAVARGVDAGVYDRATAGIRMNQSVIDAANYQPEFTRQLWEYLDAAVSDKRVRNGKNKLFQHRSDLVAMEKKYNVDASVITAIWGIESAYGENMGSINVIEALMTLGYEGKRRKFAEPQLIEALKIIQRGDIGTNRMVGSWAGAMGHTQFIPTSYQAYAQDFTGDGRRNVWDNGDPRDALASTGNYLKEFGWQLGRPWGLEVRLPSNFNYGAADQDNRQPVEVWNNAGVRTMNGQPIPNHGRAAIITPAGAKGPAFAVYKNFYVIKRYNNATSYAIAVGHLSDRISGGEPFQAVWPRGEQALSFKEKQELQRRLTRKGFDTDGVDGVIGPNTIAAIKDYQRSIGVEDDGFPSKNLLQTLR